MLEADVPAIEERVAFVEGRLVEQARGMTDLRDAFVALEHRLEDLSASVARQFEAVDRRFEAVDRRFEAVDRRFEGIERRLDAIDHRMASQFLWVVGLQVTTIAAVFAAILAR
jgi:hypothetical protein